MTLPALRSAAIPLVVAAVVLALGAASAPGKGGHSVRPSRPRLVLRPSRLRAAEGLAPGDRIERLVELRRRGRGRFTAVYFRVRARKGSVLAAGLRVAIDRCSKKWRKRGAGYMCRGRRFAVLTRRPLLGRTKLRNVGLRTRRLAHLRLVVALPAQAGNALQQQSTALTYSFVGVTASRR